MDFASDLGLVAADGPGLQNFSQQLLGGVGRLTTAVSTAIGAVTSIIMIMVIGIFIAMEPHLYDRGLAWMLPVERRARFYEISNQVGFTLRRLLAGRIVGMAFEGVFTFVMLTIGGVPFAALLGLLTGLLAFIPNIGALISGILMVAVGFSAGTGEGLWAIFVYFFVQNVDGYLVVPYIARRTVNLAPAVVLAAQLLFGALFGILGLLLADPIVATIKTTLEKLSETRDMETDKGKADAKSTPPRPRRKRS
jgi:predicted PurR-regulated permease PerM